VPPGVGFNLGVIQPGALLRTQTRGASRLRHLPGSLAPMLVAGGWPFHPLWKWPRLFLLLQDLVVGRE
jgi:hypothetical protein